jgi:hypothetical protein
VINRRWLFLLLVLAVAVTQSATGNAIPARAAQDFDQSDGYHYEYWADGQHDGFYTEWWYFNLIDPTTNVRAVFTYLVFDPANLTGLGRSQIAAVSYTPAGTSSAIDVYPTSAVSASYTQADVNVAANSIRVTGPGQYRITGATKDGRMSWELTYAQRGEVWLGANRTPVGRLAWEKMSWLVDMPSAFVTGRLTIDGQDHEVQASGYHDHNWGKWIFTDATWNWAQYSQPGLAIDLGDFIGKPAGVLGVNIQGQQVVFDKTQYQVVHTRWERDATNNIFYPVETWVFAHNDQMRLSLKITATESLSLRAELPFPIPDPVIYEQVATYQGQAWTRIRGVWSSAVTISGDGFKEYTANAWP